MSSFTPAELFMICCASISVVGSFLVILTSVIFPRMRISQFMRFIVSISVCTLLGSMMILGGNQTAGTDACFVQGLFVTFFNRTSYFLTVALGLQLSHLVIYGKLIVPELYHHITSWGLSIFCSIIITAGPPVTYGSDPIYSNKGKETLTSNYIFQTIIVISLFM